MCMTRPRNTSLQRTLPHPDAQVFAHRHNIDVLEQLLQLKSRYHSARPRLNNAVLGRLAAEPYLPARQTCHDYRRKGW